MVTQEINTIFGKRLRSETRITWSTISDQSHSAV